MYTMICRLCLWSTVCKILTTLFSSQNDFEGVWWLRFATMSSCALVFKSGKNSTWSGRAQANGWRTKIRQDYQVESFRNCNPKHFFFISFTFHFKVPFFSCLLLSMMVWSWGNPWPFWGTLPRFLTCLIIGIPRTWWVSKKSMSICIGNIWLLVSTAQCTSR